MDTEYYITEDAKFKLCTYEWLSLITVTVTVMALAVVAWFALDMDVENLPPREDFTSFSIVEK